MSLLIKDKVLSETQCRHIDIDEPLPQDQELSVDLTLPLSRWLAERSSINTAARVGVRLNGDEDLNPLIAHLAGVDLIALSFGRFADGRNYSVARLLRERYGYRGELRAVGDVLQDQLYFLARCGVDAFELNPHKSYRDAESLLRAFSAFSVQYQPAADAVKPAQHLRRLSS